MHLMSPDRLEDDPEFTPDARGPVERVEPNPNVELALVVPFDADDLRGLDEIARERGTTSIEAARQIVHDAVVARSR